MVLEKLESRTGKPTSELFDLIAGTSTGGIIAMAMTVPDEDGRPRWSAHDFLRFYPETARTTFPHSLPHLMRSADGLLDEKYDPAGIDEVARKLLGDRMLSETLTDVIVSGYSLEERKPIFFKSAKAKANAAYDLPLRVVTRGATAAPTYFPPAKIEIGDQDDYLAVVDGGVFANNPAMSAFVEAKRMYPDAEISVLSLGTGMLTTRIRYDDAKHWGAARWARPMLQVTLDGSNHAIDYQLKHLLGPGRYLRLQPMLTEGGSRLDDASEDNLRMLRLTAQRQIESQEKAIGEICEQLTS
jgi:patatin-like phospholipase/acyl hydrolase